MPKPPSTFHLPPSKPKLRVALVCDWMTGGGAERVVLELHDMFPEAPIYTSYCSSEWRDQLDPAPVITGWTGRWPFSKMRKFIPLLRIWWFSRLKLDGYDLVISSSGAEAKGIRVPKGTVHINYCHAPTHYYWARYEDYLANPGLGRLNGLGRLGLKLLVGPLRAWDRRAAQRPHVMVANSGYIAEQIKKYYGREVEVIHPPVDIDRFRVKADRRHAFVVNGRQTPYKRIDLAVSACSELNVALLVIGNGPEQSKLRKLAGRSVTFLTKVTDHDLALHLASAEAFIFPGVDDFGIAAVEALSAGTPVVAFKGGGALDYIEEGKNGLFFSPQTVRALVETLQKVSGRNFDHASISTSAKAFAPDVFQRKMTKLISEKV